MPLDLFLDYSLFNFVLGLIIGAVIRYTGIGNPRNHEVVTLPTNSVFLHALPPDSLQLRIISEDLETNTSRPLYFEYNYKGPIKRIAVDSNVELDEKVRSVVPNLFHAIPSLEVPPPDHSPRGQWVPVGGRKA